MGRHKRVLVACHTKTLARGKGGANAEEGKSKIWRSTRDPSKPSFSGYVTVPSLTVNLQLRRREERVSQVFLVLPPRRTTERVRTCDM